MVVGLRDTLDSNLGRRVATNETCVGGRRDIPRPDIRTGIPGYGRASKAIFIVLVISLAAGSRFGQVDISASFLRSVHLADLLVPAMFAACVYWSSHVRRSMPKLLHLAWISWLFYCFFASQIGHFLSGLALETTAFLAAMLYIYKEVEFYLIAAFSSLVAYRCPRFATNCLWLVSAAMVFWIAFEVTAPTGYYFLGLPFEKGAIQTGLVYGALSLFVVGEMLTLKPTGWWLRSLGWALAFFLMVGMLLSLSRTAALGFVAGIAFICLSKPSRLVKSVAFVGLLMIAILPISTDPAAAAVYELVFGRWADFSQHSGYRVDKWLELISFQMERPLLLIFGAGFGSPNPLVFGAELGHILAVDNAFVRRVFEVGVVGTTVFALLIGSLSLFLLRKEQLRPFFAVVLFYLFSGLTAETFQITQSAGLFSVIVGVVLGRFSRSAIGEVKSGVDAVAIARVSAVPERS